MKSHFPLIITLGILIAIASGCTASNSPLGSNPVGPDPAMENSLNAASQQSTGAHLNRTLWGLWQVTMAPGTETLEITPLRTAMFTANVNNLLEGKSGNLLITDMDVTKFSTEGRLDCTIGLKHPLPGLQSYSGFDVWGVFLHNGSTPIGYDNLVYSDGTGSDEAALLNPDGFTRWYNFPEFNGPGSPIFDFWPGKLANLPAPTATLNPYRIFADNLGVNDDYSTWIKSSGNDQTRNVFSAGVLNSRRYELKFPMPAGQPVVSFQYAVVATWEPGDPTLTGNPATYEPFDFPTSANVEEAFFTSADTSGSNLFYVDSDLNGGVFKASIEIFDWQGGIVGHAGVVNEIERIMVNANFLPTGSFEIPNAQIAAVALPGTENSSVFQVEISGCTPQASGDTSFWVITEAKGLNASTYGQGFPTAYPDKVRAAFLKGNVNISDQSAELAVSSILPNTAPFWGKVTGAEITGSNFAPGATVELRKTAQPPVIPTNIVWVDSNTITCDLDLTNVDSGAWDVVVINPSLEEGALPAGFTIDVWSDESVIDTSGNRLPQMAETSAGSSVLLFGCNDNKMRYTPFEEGVGYSAVDVAVDNNGGHWLLVMTEDPVNDNVYLASNLDDYRYTGNPGLWDYVPSGWLSANAGAIVADLNGKMNLFQNTSNAFGHINHSREVSWGGALELYLDNVMDGWNINVFGDGNMVTQNSAGTIFIAYERDWWLNQYGQQQPGPRWVKVCWAPLNQLVSYNMAEIDTATNMNALDSLSIDCDSADILHAGYRRWNPGLSKWQVVYKRSTSGGPGWGSESVIYEGDTAPDTGYVFMQADSNNKLSTVYDLAGLIKYRNSSDGSTWSTVEDVNPSASGNPPGIKDFQPRELVTSDGIMHVAWVRGDPTVGYGDIYHRMRDLY
jgi:hypothetical protein